MKDGDRARAPIVRIPYGVFWALLKAYALFDRDPPFTTKQLEALVTPDVFEVIDWPAIFGVQRHAARRGARARPSGIRPIRKIVLEF